VTAFSSYVFSTLRPGEFTLRRGFGDGLPPILLVAPSGEHPRREALERLEHEYALRAELVSDWAARPIELAHHHNRVGLVLEDPGGELLDTLLGRPLEMTLFLRISIALVTALRHVHERGLIHKDIKPANVLVSIEGDAVWLTGFGIASRLPREHQLAEPPEIITGTLAYMAPEQTGRMNRSVDSRSDLYSLGVTLYELLTGKLPFTASDAMEWIHCHIARPPTPPSERVPGIPPPLETIILKLLAKTAEDRYQTAAGVEADLRQCLASLKAYGRIDSFPLGANDVPDRLLIPEKLYGREAAIEALVAGFDRLVAGSKTEFVLVAGYSGIGKSSVVNELHKVLVPPRGLFAAGKFDRYKRDVPYATLAQAFQSLVHRILGKDDAELGRWREAMLEAVGTNGQLMINLIPELTAIIGEQPPVPELPPQDAQNRFQMVLRRFLGVFAKPEHPLAIFLDDLQWLDEASLALVERLVIDRDVDHLLLVGAYRNNEVDQSHPLARTLGAISRAGGRINEIVLAPLNPDDLGRLVGDALHAAPDRVRPLAELIFEKTAGNPFFAIQFMTALAEEKLLAFDPDGSLWRWDMDRIRAKGFTDNVADLMAGKLSRLSTRIQEALGVLACLGSAAKATTADLMHETAGDVLWEAARVGLVIRQDSNWSFIHDRVHEAAYGLIPESERPATHLRIGRLLVARAAPGELEENIFDIVNQLDRALPLITTRAERERVAALNLLAGKRAKAATAYASALQYLMAGSTLLAGNRWKECYELAFDLELNRAECEYLTGDPVSAEGRLVELSSRAQTTIDAAAVACTRLDLCTALGRINSAVDVGLEYLRRIETHWPLQVSAEIVRQEYGHFWQQLGSRSIEELSDLPLLTDPDLRATMNVLTALTSPTFFSDENLFHLVVARMVMLSLEHGNCDGSCLAYAWLGSILGMRFGDYPAGYRFGKLSLNLVENHGLNRFRARVYLVYAVHVAHWTQPLAISRDYLQHAFKAAQDSGDLSYAAYSCVDLISNLFAAGDPLSRVEREAQSRLDIVGKVRFDLISENISAELALVRMLRGETQDLNYFKKTEVDKGDSERQLRIKPQLPVSAVRYLQACIYMGDDASVSVAVSNAEPHWSVPTHFEVAEYHFYGALARAKSCDRTSGEERDRHLEALAAHHKQIEVWAENCPATFANRAALISAEVARLKGRELDAERFYEEAVLLAHEHGFIQNEALAFEFAARFYTLRGLETIARAYLQNARYCYLSWGAEGKVRQLEQLHPHLRAEPTSAYSTATFGGSVEQLDIATVVKASQAVSGEIVLSHLIETLMTIALEHAGAERGVLILLQGNEPQIEAEARIGPQAVEVTLRQVAVSSAVLPEAVLHTVLRTRRSVILDDAQRSTWLEDEYTRRRRPRSMLCLPLLKRAKLVGLLYLENNLAPGAFTSQRAAVLELLASQAAISLENARLYEGLRRSEAFLAEGQRLSQTGSWQCKMPSGDLTWSPEHFRILGFEAGETKPSLAVFWDRVHPEDRQALEQVFDEAIREKSDFDKEFRIVLPDGSIKQVYGVGHAVVDEFGDLVEFIGTTMDVTERKLAGEALRSTQAELARVARLTTMGELAASIAHEINQPLAAVVTSADAGRRWLNRTPPDLNEACAAFSRIASNGKRAGDVIHSLRALAKRTGPELSRLDINDAIREVLTLVAGTLRQQNVALQTELFAGDGPVLGDRVQVQQVLLNLIMNGIEAMTAVTDRFRILTISSKPVENGAVLVAVADTGTGLDPGIADRIFEALFTTKPEGMGMGLSICRSIIEAHGGRLWASPNRPHGTVFKFLLPSVAAETS
jgi:PAS domain S-box-containing protein